MLKEWKNLGVRAMLAETKPRVATNIIFTTVVMSLLTLKYPFLGLQICHFVFATMICC